MVSREQLPEELHAGARRKRLGPELAVVPAGEEGTTCLSVYVPAYFSSASEGREVASCRGEGQPGYVEVAMTWLA